VPIIIKCERERFEEILAIYPVENFVDAIEWPCKMCIIRCVECCEKEKQEEEEEEMIESKSKKNKKKKKKKKKATVLQTQSPNGCCDITRVSRNTGTV
jgi:hypothetical protein